MTFEEAMSVALALPGTERASHYRQPAAKANGHAFLSVGHEPDTSFVLALDVGVIDLLLAMHPGAHLVVVCHGGVINAYLAHLLGIREDMFFLPAHTSVTRVRRMGPRRALHSLNDRDHLTTAEPALLTY